MKRSSSNSKKAHRVQRDGGVGRARKQSPGPSQGPERESCRYWRKPTPMHSSAKSPGLPGESQDERLTHIQRGWGSGAATNTHKNLVHKQERGPTRTQPLPPSPVCLIVLSVRMVSQPRSAAGILCNTRRLVKHNWLIYWLSGPEVGGILDAPPGSYRGIIQRGQRARSGKLQGRNFTFLGSMPFFESGIVVLC